MDDLAIVAATQMMAGLASQEDCIRITASKLVSWIVTRFAENGFERDREAIIREHFNSKDYLKKVIRSLDSKEDMAAALQEALVKIGPAVRVAKPKGQAHTKGSKPPQEDAADRRRDMRPEPCADAAAASTKDKGQGC